MASNFPLAYVRVASQTYVLQHICYILGTGTRVRQTVELTRAAAGLPGHAHLAALLLLPRVDLRDAGAAQQHAALLAVHGQQDAGEVRLGGGGGGLRGLDAGGQHQHGRGLRLVPDLQPRHARGRAAEVPRGAPSLGRVLVHGEDADAAVGLLHPQRVPALDITTSQLE